jgi:cation/acetate symporter
MADRDQVESYRSRAWLFTLAFLGALVLLAMLGNFGLPDSALGTTLGAGVLVAFIIAGVSERTIQAGEFFSGGSVPAFVSGIGGAAAFLSAPAIIGLAGIQFSDYRAGIVLVLGWSLGFVLLAVLIAPYYKRSSADSVADFLAIRYRSRAVRLAAAVAVAAALAPALVATIATAVAIIGDLLAVSPRTARLIVVALVLSGTLLGGLRAVTLTAIAQYIVVAIAFLVPAAIISTQNFSLPIPQIGAGFAYEAVAAAPPLAPSPPPGYLPFMPRSAFELFATVVSLAAGVAALPHLLMRHAATESAPAARRSAGWALVLVLLIAMAAPAYAMFAKMAILREVAGATIDQIPDWFYALGGKGLATLCGQAVTSVIEANAACASAEGAPIAAGMVSVSGDAIVLGWGDIVGLPYVSTALITVGMAAAALAAANAMAFAIAQVAGNDIYGRLLDTRASAGRRLIVTRLILVGIVLLAAGMEARPGDEVFRAALAGVSLSAGALFPVVVLAIWWKRANGFGALAGIVFGFGATAAILLGKQHPGMLPFDPSDLSELSAAIVGMPAAFFAAVVGSLATPPSDKQAAFVDEIRQPAGARAASP